MVVAKAKLTEAQERRLAQLVAETERLRVQARQAEEKLSELTRTLAIYESDLIPNLLMEFDVEEAQLADGTQVSIGRSIKVSPKKENMAEVAAWVSEVGRGDLISRTVTVEYPKGVEVGPKNLCRYLQRREMGYTLEPSIHHSSLRALVEGLMRLGKKVPEELLGVFSLKKAIIKTPVFEGEA